MRCARKIPPERFFLEDLKKTAIMGLFLNEEEKTT
jgi:hypothetical protein